MCLTESAAKSWNLTRARAATLGDCAVTFAAILDGSSERTSQLSAAGGFGSLFVRYQHEDCLESESGRGDQEVAVDVSNLSTAFNRRSRH